MKFPVLIAACTVLVLAGCAESRTAEDPGAEVATYPVAPIRPTWRADEMLVRWHRLTPLQLVGIGVALCQGMNSEECSKTGELLGFSIPDFVGKTCDVYVPEETMDDGDALNKVHILGHEVYHCFDGRFHVNPATLEKPADGPMSPEELAEGREIVARGLQWAADFTAQHPMTATR